MQILGFEVLAEATLTKATMRPLGQRVFVRNIGALGGLLLAAACGGGGTGPHAPADIALNPASVSFTAVGETEQLTATVTDQDGNTLNDVSITWSTTDPGVATVSSSGAVTATGSGSAQISAQAGSANASAQVTVSQTPTQMEQNSGNGQTAVAGQPVAVPPSVLVTDANHQPVPGVEVTFETEPGAGQISGGSVSTDENGIAQVGSWILGSKGPNVLQAVAAGTGINGNPVSFTATGTSSFTITLQFLGSSTATQRQAFIDAESRWESLITGDLEDIPLQAPADSCGTGSPAVNQTIDDLLIFVKVETIDGPGGVLGSAGPCYIRNSNGLSVLGTMIFDTEDLQDIEAAGLLKIVILHEMGHVLGFGSLWPTQNLLVDPSLPPDNGIDPHFVGAQAIAAFNAVGGSGYTGAKVPVENTGGNGTADGHWRESVFGNELMTGFVDPGQDPLSVVTLASLVDQGYTVNRAGADPYSLTLSLRAGARGPHVQLGNDLLRLPIRKVDRRGQVTGTLRR
jgi:hypothetical protein